MELNKEIDLEPLTHKIIGCAMQVHALLGSGLPEDVYRRAFALELTFEEMPFEKELEMPIVYRDEQIGICRADFVIETKVMVEIISVPVIEDNHRAKTIGCLQAFNVADGLLINFGNFSLDFKRVYNKKVVVKK